MNTKKYLESIRELKQSRFNGKMEYCGYEDLVLREGRAFPEIREHYYPMGRKKECFSNASKLVQQHSELIYCEGWACSVIDFPFEHGWCVDLDGCVIDPTWADGYDYFGLSVSSDYLLETINRTGHYGLLDFWNGSIIESKFEGHSRRLKSLH